jgi:uncharacterized protein YkwD
MLIKGLASKKIIVGIFILTVLAVILVFFINMHNNTKIVDDVQEDASFSTSNNPNNTVGNNTMKNTSVLLGSNVTPKETSSGGGGSGTGAEGFGLSENKQISIVGIEDRVHYYVNLMRTENGLSQLNFDVKLTAIARNYSIDLLNNGYITDEILEGQDFSYRYQQAGYNCSVLYRTNPDGTKLYANGGENVAMIPTGNVLGCGDVYSEDQIANCIVITLMENHGYRTNILTSYWSNEGIGAAISSKGNVYVTENFC